MAIIPNDEKVFMVSNTTNTTYSGSQALKDMNEWYTMEDVKNTVLPYKVYTALLTQSGEGDPGATVFENTTNIIGSFERWTDGRYLLNFTSSTTIDKFFIPNSGTYQDTAGVAMPLYDGSAIVGYVTLAPYFIDSTTITKLIIDCNDSSGKYTDLSNLIGTGGVYIEIRVYN
jgi:hypothetical protein